MSTGCQERGWSREWEVAAGGCSDTQYQFGIQLLQSASRPGSLAEALAWIKSAAQQGHVEAQQLLGEIGRQGAEQRPCGTP